MNLRSFLLLMLLPIGSVAHAQEVDPVECSKGRNAARADISAGKAKYYRFGLGGRISCGMFEYMAYTQFRIRAQPFSDVVEDEYVCYNQVIDSYLHSVLPA